VTHKTTRKPGQDWISSSCEDFDIIPNDVIPGLLSYYSWMYISFEKLVASTSINQQAQALNSLTIMGDQVRTSIGVHARETITQIYSKMLTLTFNAISSKKQLKAKEHYPQNDT
jgi:hypothetical protein